MLGLGDDNPGVLVIQVRNLSEKGVDERLQRCRVQFPEKKKPQ